MTDQNNSAAVDLVFDELDLIDRLESIDMEPTAYFKYVDYQSKHNSERSEELDLELVEDSIEHMKNHLELYPSNEDLVFAVDSLPFKAEPEGAAPTVIAALVRRFPSFMTKELLEQTLRVMINNQMPDDIPELIYQDLMNQIGITPEESDS